MKQRIGNHCAINELDKLIEELEFIYEVQTQLGLNTASFDQ